MKQPEYCGMEWNFGDNLITLVDMSNYSYHNAHRPQGCDVVRAVVTRAVCAISKETTYLGLFVDVSAVVSSHFPRTQPLTVVL